MASPIWGAPALDWTNEEQTQGQVKVTTLHWRATLEADGFTASSYGATPDDQNRVYTKPALENVPGSVVIGWIQQALGAEEVARIEQALLDDIAEQKNPTSGSVTPGA